MGGWVYGGGQNAAGAQFERRRREDWGAEGAEGDGVWGGGVLFLILALNMMSFGAFWMVCFKVHLVVLHAK